MENQILIQIHKLKQWGIFKLADTVAACFEIKRICFYMVLSHGIYRILWFMVPSHEILKLNEAEPSMAGAVVPEHKNTTLQ